MWKGRRAGCLGLRRLAGGGAGSEQAGCGEQGAAPCERADGHACRIAWGR